MRRDLGQLRLADGLVAGGAGRNRQLERIAALVDWAASAWLLGEMHAAPARRPPHGPVVLLRRLSLQQWYGLSDRRFVRLALADPVPDHSTMSRLCGELAGWSLAAPLLAELNRQLDAEDQAPNPTIGRIRAPVERTFAILKRWHGSRRVRYRSLARNGLQLQLLACAVPWC